MICADASVAVKWVLPEEYSDRALALYTASIAAAEPIVAPALLPIEVANILRQRMVREQLSLADARQLLSHFLSFPISYPASHQLSLRALELAATYNLPAVYDAHYLALAEQLSCPLWTADRRLLRAVRGSLSYVHAISDYVEQGS
jgi:predicted nucleic acid-binding protein